MVQLPKFTPVKLSCAGLVPHPPNAKERISLPSPGTVKRSYFPKKPIPFA
jgi:hypothetical protein